MLGGERLRQTPADGYVLLGALILTLILSFLGMTSLFLAGQDIPGISAMKEETVAQELADSASELIMSWFHDPNSAPASVSGLFAKRQGDAASGPSFFDTAKRSQFIGTADRPDVLLDAAQAIDDNLLNSPPSGFSGSLRGIGRFTKFKLYGPLRPGLLGTLEVTATTDGFRSIARTVQVQLGALAIPAVRAAVQVGRGLGTHQTGGESPVRVHWGDQRIMGELIVRRIEDIVTKSIAAPVTGQPYEPLDQSLDRWTDYWIGGDVTVTVPPPGQGVHLILPQNVHFHQVPSPGVRLDQWDYDSAKQTALRHGIYYRLDRQGLLHVHGASENDPGIAPSEILLSRAIGDRRGLVFVDTIDGQPPRDDNLGTLTVDGDYLEAVLIVQGHVVLKSGGPGRSVPALSPPQDGTNAFGTRIPTQLTGIHFQGLLWAAGTVFVERSVRVFGAVRAGESVVATRSGASIEIWYNADLAQGLFCGLPVVYRAPGTWRLL